MTVTKQFCDHCGNEVRNGNALRPVELHPFHWGATTVRHVCAKCLKDIEEYIGTAKHTKPPLGVTPRWLADEMRVREIAEAILRYTEVGKPVPQEWLDELNEKTKKEETK